MIDIILKPLKLLLRLNFIKSKIKKENTEILKIEDIYTPLSEAKEEIWRRWDDKELRKKVDEFLGDDMPEFFKNGPFAVMVRHVASPNKEFFRFKDIACLTNLPLVICEFSSDKFTAKNKLKYHLSKMYFYEGFGKNGGAKISSQKIVNFDKSEGKKIKELEISNGNNFIEFHHGLLEPYFENNNLFDISEWLMRKGSKSDQFYVYYLSLFLNYGILFENFASDKEEKKLTENVVIPAMNTLRKKFGCKPLVVPILPFEDEADTHWSFYHENVKNCVKL